MIDIGTTSERAPGSWELTMSVGLDPATGRYRRVIRHIMPTSKREAKVALAELESAVAKGRISFDDPTVSDLLDRWLEHIAGLGRSATTLYHYRQYVDREIVPVLGGIRLSKLSTLEIDALYTKLRKRAQCAGCPMSSVDPATSSRWIRLGNGLGVRTQQTRGGRQRESPLA